MQPTVPSDTTQLAAPAATPAPASPQHGLSKRFKHLVATGGAPAALASVAGDVLGPKGGWAVLLLLAFLCAVVLVLIVAYLANRNPEAPLPKVLRPFSDEETSWWWQGRSALRCHGVYVLLVFGGICGYTGWKTFQNLEQGGVLARNSDMVAALQKQTGIMEAQLAEMKKGNERLGEISRNTAAAKKETSEDPRKELLNLGFGWSNEEFFRAVRQVDLRAVDLYVQAGFRATSRKDSMAHWAIQSGSDELAALTAKVLSPLEPAECRQVYYAITKDRARTPGLRALVDKTCSTPEARRFLADTLANYQRSKQDWEAKYSTPFPGADYERLQRLLEIMK